MFTSYRTLGLVEDTYIIDILDFCLIIWYAFHTISQKPRTMKTDDGMIEDDSRRQKEICVNTSDMDGDNVATEEHEILKNTEAPDGGWGWVVTISAFTLMVKASDLKFCGILYYSLASFRHYPDTNRQS